MRSDELTVSETAGLPGTTISGSRRLHGDDRFDLSSEGALRRIVPRATSRFPLRGRNPATSSLLFYSV